MTVSARGVNDTVVCGVARAESTLRRRVQPGTVRRTFAVSAGNTADDTEPEITRRCATPSGLHLCRGT